jgi:hypothetical protein
MPLFVSVHLKAAPAFLIEDLPVLKCQAVHRLDFYSRFSGGRIQGFGGSSC